MALTTSETTVERSDRELTTDDVTAAFAAGWRDLQRAPLYSLPFGAVYAGAGALLVWLLFTRGEDHLVFPMASMFLLIGPLTAVGLYEVSRRIEAGEPLAYGPILLAFARHGGLQLGVFGVVLAFVAIFWAKTAAFVYALHFGVHPVPLDQILTAVTTTTHGLQFFVIGTAIGAVFAALVFAISVIGVPMLLDRDVDPVTAIIASVSAVAANPMPFLGFAIMVVALIAVGIGTFFVGLVVTLPMVGHATWHLYRRTTALRGE